MDGSGEVVLEIGRRWILSRGREFIVVEGEIVKLFVFMISFFKFCKWIGDFYKIKRYIRSYKLSFCKFYYFVNGRRD